jgi:hypothetical protein
LQAIQPAWQIDVGYDQIDIVAMFKDCDGFVGASGWNCLATSFLKHKLQILTGEDFIQRSESNAPEKPLLRGWQTLPELFRPRQCRSMSIH